MNDKSNDDLQFLRNYYEKLLGIFGVAQHLGGSDFSQNKSLLPSPEAERCARLADQIGFNGSIFRNLFSRDGIKSNMRATKKQLEMIPRIIAVIELRSSLEGKAAPALTKEDINILEFLLTKRTISVVQADIAAGVHLDRKTVGKRLQSLRDKRLVERPNGARGGDAITDLGCKYLADR